jgi:hypothetical protein
MDDDAEEDPGVREENPEDPHVQAVRLYRKFVQG